MENNVAYQQLALEIRKSILDGTLKPGKKLPGELVLAKNYNVSRTTVRLAIKELEKESLVYRRQGSGTFVSATPNKAPVTRSNFTDFVKGLKQKVTREVLESSWVEATPELASYLNIPVRSALLWFRRLDKIDDKIMAFDDGWIFGPYAHLLGADDLCVLDFYEHWQQKQNIKVAKSDVEIAAGAADKETAERLKIKKGAPVLIEISNIFTKDNGAARFRTIYKHDMYRFKRTFHYK